MAEQETEDEEENDRLLVLDTRAGAIVRSCRVRRAAPRRKGEWYELLYVLYGLSELRWGLDLWLD